MCISNVIEYNLHQCKFELLCEHSYIAQQMRFMYVLITITYQSDLIIEEAILHEETFASRKSRLLLVKGAK